MTKFFVIGICFALSSCANIPLGTMLKLSSFDESSFLALNPNDLRTKIHLDKPLEININKTELSLILKTSKGESIFNYPLKLISSKTIPTEKSWLNTIPERTEYNLVLSPDAISSFEKLQQTMSKESPKSMAFKVTVAIAQRDKATSEMVVSIFIKLQKNSDYITLFDRAPVQFNKMANK
jgi:hypothetical protein